MANKKFTDLTSASSLAGSDILAVTVDPAGTPATRSTTITQLMGQAPVQQSDLNTLATQVSLGQTETDLTALINLRATQVSLGNHEALTQAHGISAFGATLVDDLDATAARATLGVDATGTDNSTNVTLDTTNHDYLSLTDQTVSLGAIDLSADVTGTLPFSSVGAHSIDDHSDVDTSTVAPTDGQALVWDNAQSKWEPGPAGAQNLADLGDVTITSATAEQVIKYDGSGFVNGSVAVDVDTPLSAALRGTDNPHIGAFPEQSFKVTDNPSKSVMVLSDIDGNVTYVLKESTAEVRVKAGANAPTRFALASDLPVFVLENDTGEPDIEVTEPTTGQKISVISGDSDVRGVNGQPNRQGYNFPDIGANPSPLLISGGTIA